METGRLPDLWRRSCLILLSVALSTVSLPGGSWPALGIISLVPLALALRDASPRLSGLSAYTCAFLGWLACTSGLAEAFSEYSRGSTWEGVVAVAISCLYLALPYGLFGWAYGRFHPPPVPAALLLTAIVSWFPTPLPIDSIHALAGFPQAIQILDIGGQPLLRFAFYLFTWLLAELIAAPYRRVRNAVSLVVLAITVTGYGEFRLREIRSRTSPESTRIGIVQPNIPLGGDSEPHSAEELNPFHTLIEMTVSLLKTSAAVDVVVWPETPSRITCALDNGAMRPQFVELIDRYGVPLLINCVQPAPQGGDFNSQLLLLPGGHTARYDKLLLFPFAEYLPGESTFPRIRSVFPSISHYVPAADPVVFHLGSHPGIFLAICYEILFPSHTRKLVANGGRILITPANDAWFGHSRIPDFQVAASIFQAVQFRVPVVRVSNSGNSLAITAAGEIVPNSRTPNFAKATAVFVVHTITR